MTCVRSALVMKTGSELKGRGCSRLLVCAPGWASEEECVQQPVGRASAGIGHNVRGRVIYQSVANGCC
jgi:hypothetical protein